MNDIQLQIPPGFQNARGGRKYVYCRNCRKNTHTTNKCNLPVFSYGVIALRYNPLTSAYEYLMVRPKYSIEYLAIIRGHYSPNAPEYITHLCRYITDEERLLLQKGPFLKLYEDAHGTFKEPEFYRANRLYSQLLEPTAYNKMMTWESHIKKAMEETSWTDTDWGFPKGRRERDETEYTCAFREFQEETGISPQLLNNVQNVSQFNEMYMGTDNRVYKHIYYMAVIAWADSERCTYKKEDKEIKEVRWFPFHEGISNIRNYQHHRRILLQNIHDFIHSHPLSIITDYSVGQSLLSTTHEHLSK